ncbi:pilus assembly protein TadG-related protein [Streptomyces sp. SP18CS02]|uniref:pilus assembly protein TadG-related protein n=1 Tax=Streptomyces sp. SP18CS02 TaxID=3002531 RepID=UPI002E7A91DA|nr:pilus assembly protein TadG-related protein [Streptomyces sp. SP18CS02]MEE1756293.1 pilus assembly protein TadG-related protein [Streptomyces sp. SP18CS02]
MTDGTRSAREAGQASPLYVFMVAGLLFLALAFFAVGQAGATRNGAQSAADAAALAAARESRDQFDLEGLGLDALSDLFSGDLIGTVNGCGISHSYAGQNGAEVRSCDWVADGRWGFTVGVESSNPVGDTILPGTEDQHAVAKATAIVEPRCSFTPAEDGDSPSPGWLDCEGVDLDLDPARLPDPSDLFTVRLAED